MPPVPYAENAADGPMLATINVKVKTTTFARAKGHVQELLRGP